MTQFVNKAVIENILNQLWQNDNGNVDEKRVAYNKALQQVQCKFIYRKTMVRFHFT